jgi:hypothetical protein
MLLAGALLAAAPSFAQEVTSAQGQDMRCMVAMLRMRAIPQYQAAADAGIFYYIGRIEGRDPHFDLRQGLRAYTGGMDDLAMESRRCAAELKAKNEALKALASPPSTPSPH